ncbi:MAG: porin [Rhodospirillaceae bacterium]|nr:MAG: porin [Rhodospirillaceae bacterium]
MKTTLKTILLTSVFAIAGSAAGYADDAAPAAAAPTPPALGPAMSGPLAGNASPTSFDLSAMPLLGELFGKTYVTGVVSGYGQFEDHAVPGDHKSIGDLSNAQVFIQKVDGVFQYFVQAGIYSFPYLGAPYIKASPTTNGNFGPLSQAFVKIVPADNFSVQVGKLPTLIGDEYTFSFENMNIQRGLLWAQEPAVSDGVQVNYTMGPLALSASLNDGLYSGRYNTISGAAIWTVDSSNTLAVSASGALSTFYKNKGATFVLQNNQEIYNLIYTFTSGPLTISPYVQYTHIPTLPGLGTTSTSTWGGAVLAKYAFDSNFSVAARGEYITENGSVAKASADPLGYGVGSDAWTLTVTPTYQYNIFFLRAEASVIKASTKVFGPTFKSSSQFRFAAETGILF